MNNDQVCGKMMILGRLFLETPLIIGSGEKGDFIDIAVLKDTEGNPYIPATSLAGVWRHTFFSKVLCEQKDKKQLEYFWGTDQPRDDADYYQSAFAISDLKTRDKTIVKVRDGVKINQQYGVAVDKAKFDYEVVEPGVTFDLKVEVTLRKAYDADFFRRMLFFLVRSLEQGKIQLGAMTTKGFGRCKLKQEQFYEYNFKRKQDVISWLAGEQSTQQLALLDREDIFAKKENDFMIEASFAINNSLLVRSYSANPELPDAVHINSQGQSVLPGTSIKGAVRNRALRITNTLGGQEDWLKELFGWADEQGEDRTKLKSRVTIEETLIKNVLQEIQNRIRIDRFTGGVIKSALFDTMPLWPVKNDQEMVKIIISIRDFRDWEAGLLLLVLKDLWTSDLPLGGEKAIGRGVLKGVRTVVKAGAQNIALTGEAEDSISILGQADLLEQYVEAFVARCKAEGD